MSMKKEAYDKLMQKYLAGMTRADEEAALGRMAGNCGDRSNPRFHVASKAENQFPVSFEEFMKNAAPQESSHAPVATHTSFLKYWIAIAATVFIAAASYYFFMQNEEPEKMVAEASAVAEQPVPKPELQLVNKPETMEKPDSMPPEHVKTNIKPNQQSIRQKQVPAHVENQSLFIPAQEALVIINGKPVYDQEEGKQIALQSLAMLSGNLQSISDSIKSIINL